MIDLLLFLALALALLGLAIWGLMSIAYRPKAHDPIEPHDPWLYSGPPSGTMRVPTPPLSEALYAADIPTTPHAASSQRSVAEALEVYQCTELERLLQARPEPNHALQATTQARNLGAILRALRG